MSNSVMRCPFAEWKPSPNYNKGRHKETQFLCVHITDGQPSIGRSVERFDDENSHVSPHVVVGRRGELYQLVDFDDRAWHCSGWNDASIGVEHVARTPGELDREWSDLSEHSRRALIDCDGLSEDEIADLVASETDPGMPITAAQLQASARFAAWLCKTLGWPVDRQHLRGHCECPGTTHLDCGRDIADGGIFPWSDYIAAVIVELSKL